jgi:hypothetical protein
MYKSKWEGYLEIVSVKFSSEIRASFVRTFSNSEIDVYLYLIKNKIYQCSVI